MRVITFTEWCHEVKGIEQGHTFKNEEYKKLMEEYNADKLNHLKNDDGTDINDKYLQQSISEYNEKKQNNTINESYDDDYSKPENVKRFLNKLAYELSGVDKSTKEQMILNILKKGASAGVMGELASQLPEIEELVKEVLVKTGNITEDEKKDFPDIMGDNEHAIEQIINDQMGIKDIDWKNFIKEAIDDAGLPGLIATGTLAANGITDAIGGLSGAITEGINGGFGNMTNNLLDILSGLAGTVTPTLINKEVQESVNQSNERNVNATNQANINMQNSANQTNLEQQRLANEGNLEQVKETNESNQAINNANIQYQKEFNQQIFDREDNAIQRQVEDSRLAGISPLANMAGAGSGGSASAPASTLGNQAGTLTAGTVTPAVIQPFLKEAFRMDDDLMSKIMGNLKTNKELESIATQNGYTKELTEIKQEEKRGLKIANKYMEDKQKEELEQIRLSNSGMALANNMKREDFKYLMEVASGSKEKLENDYRLKDLERKYGKDAVDGVLGAMSTIIKLIK